MARVARRSPLREAVELGLMYGAGALAGRLVRDAIERRRQRALARYLDTLFQCRRDGAGPAAQLAGVQCWDGTCPACVAGLVPVPGGTDTDLRRYWSTYRPPAADDDSAGEPPGAATG